MNRHIRRRVQHTAGLGEDVETGIRKSPSGVQQRLVVSAAVDAHGDDVEVSGPFSRAVVVRVDAEADGMDSVLGHPRGREDRALVAAEADHVIDSTQGGADRADPLGGAVAKLLRPPATHGCQRHAVIGRNPESSQFPWEDGFVLQERQHPFGSQNPRCGAHREVHACARPMLDHITRFAMPRVFGRRHRYQIDSVLHQQVHAVWTCDPSVCSYTILPASDASMIE